MTIRYILLDIEGTTSDINFVHNTLFPYSATRMTDFVRQHRALPEVEQAVAMVRETVEAEQNNALDEDGVIETLLAWIQQDRKHTALKLLQGLIWQEGFEKGEYQAQVYEDVPPCLEAWKSQGLTLGIYSSGSVFAQKLFFRHTVAGDLSGYFSHHFDTTVGSKKEAASYRNIAAALTLPPEEIVFFSDVADELKAAAEAGLQTVLVCRDGFPESSPFRQVQSFREFSALSAPV